MPVKFSRRIRLLILTTVGIVIFVAGVSVLIWFLTKPQPMYRPGEKIEGLSSGLARTIPEDYPKINFVDASAEAGIAFRHFNGERSTQLPEDMGSGAAWGDYDKDGWLDVYIVNQAGPLTLSAEEIASSPAHSALYHNNGDGTFTEVSAAAGVDWRAQGMAAAWGDYDNDGWLDLFVTAYGENIIFHNNGDGTFEDHTAQTGLGGIPGFWVGASWADFNRDGFLDLYVCGYVKYVHLKMDEVTRLYDIEIPSNINPSSFEPERSLLYRNNGDGTFSEIAEKAGVSDHKGRSLSAAWCDFDDDGWPDLYVANDVSDNALFRNLGNETFEEISLAAWVADYRGAMGLGVGDWDGDLDMDIFITHWLAQENALYSNLLAQFASLDSAETRAARFMDEADLYGLGQIGLDYIGWGTSFFDYDNDGKLDLFVVNGSTFQEKDNPRLLIPMRDLLFWNRGPRDGFYEVSRASGAVFQQIYVGRGAAFGDYDNDGDVDILVVNNGGPAVLLRNDGGNRRHWLKVALEGRQSNRSAIGAKLRLVAGNSVQVRQVGAQRPYCSQNSLIQHFGLGRHARVDTLEIRWPSGTRQLVLDVPADQMVRVVEEGDEKWK